MRGEQFGIYTTDGLSLESATSVTRDPGDTTAVGGRKTAKIQFGLFLLIVKEHLHHGKMKVVTRTQDLPNAGSQEVQLDAPAESISAIPPSPPADPYHYVRDWKNTYAASGWWHSFELPDGRLIEGVCDLVGLKNRIGQYPIPADLRGKRVLDIGTWDGWFAFEMEQRGAEVVAIDCWDNPRFHEVQALLGSRVDYREMDVYDLHPDRIGRFDIVLFMGVLYHLKHPLLALERVCSVTKEMAVVDSFVVREEHRPASAADTRPIMEFYENDELGGQTDNWSGPNVQCLMAMCRAAGFARVDFLANFSHSACLACYRHWQPVLEEPVVQAPNIIDVFHHLNFGINFSESVDDYLTCWFDSESADLTIYKVRPEVGGYGVIPIYVSRAEGGHWQTNFKLPPGLKAGWHEVRVGTTGSPLSAAYKIAVDVPLGSPDLLITGVQDGITWQLNQVDLTKGRSLSIWLTGLPENADRHNVKVYLSGKRLPVAFLETRTDQKPRQLNAEVPDHAPEGQMQLSVKVGDGVSAPVAVEILRTS